MRLNHADVVLSMEGPPLQEGDGDGGLRDMTFRSLVLSALDGMAPGENLSAEDKARCYQLSLKFLRGRFVTLTVEEAAFIQKRGGVLLRSLAYGRLVDWLEGNPQIIVSDDLAGEDVDDLADEERK